MNELLTNRNPCGVAILNRRAGTYVATIGFRGPTGLPMSRVVSGGHASEIEALRAAREALRCEAEAAASP